MTLCALLNIHFLKSFIMDKNNVMYAGFSTLPTLSLRFRRTQGSFMVRYSG